MHEEHRSGADEAIKHGHAAGLFPLDSLDARVVRDRNAELLRGESSPEGVIPVRPTGWASSYFLGQHALTLIEIASLPPGVSSNLRSAIDVDLDDYTHIQVGKQNRSASDRSLREF